jgi:tetratricopeptide (TPR) repeat protein
LSSTASESHLIVEDVVQALTQTGEVRGEKLLREQMQRAADEFDETTAKAFAKALLDELCTEPKDLRKLEALMILGLAHPSVLVEHRIPLAVEGRRLAIRLERAGDPERARCLLEVIASRLPEGESVERDLSDMESRTGSKAELVQRYLSRAEESVHAGRPMEAIPWLQQVLLLDRTRRDVARMIRDLRYHESERKAARRRRLRLVGFVCLVSALVVGVVVRERRIEDAYRGLPDARGEELADIRARLGHVQGLVDDHRFWFGMSRVLNERRQLRSAIDVLEARVSDQALEQRRDDARRAQMAEAARESGLEAAKRGEFDAALEDLRRALALAAPNWSGRERIQSDIAAIEAWRRENP